MTQSPFAPFGYQNMAPTAAAGFKSKRKRMSWGAEEEESGSKHMRVRSPTMQYSNYAVPDLVADHSNNASDDDQVMDMDQDMDMADSSSAVGPSSPVDNYSQGSYAYESGGSGGFGFGPGAEEDGFDDLEMVDDMGAKYTKNFPSLTPHPNPHHFSNQGTGMRGTSPLAAQAFSTGLPAPPTRGVYQPTASAPLAANATDIDRARSQHGPWCKSIPKLIMSEYPGANGKRSMWTVCSDCGACEQTTD
ncbi:hypothetical protein B9479_002271 [Cryptococcus floricola]|uniref:Uncharacterized protein n=1 Tax=Cryptococcus floricola TaxID=2591691 RepID=A0A5D3B1N1_9TREE|nr:hypothetical protein B9479_002271 [Cryptococcus floricola]